MSEFDLDKMYTMSTFADDCKKVIEGSVDGFTKADDDVFPTLFCVQPQDNLESPKVLVFFPPDETELDVAFRVAAEHSKASSMCFVTAAWGLALEIDENDEVVDEIPESIKDHPDRLEVIILIVSDRESSTVFTNQLIRYEDKPPELTEWKRNTDPSGRLVSLMQETLRSVNG